MELGPVDRAVIPLAGLTLAASALGLVGVAAVPTAAATPTTVPAVQPRVDYSGVIATLKAEIPQMLAESGAVGLTIALVDGQRTVWTSGFGYANRETKRPVTSDTLFHIGSTSKTMTAMAVMQLVQQGLVDLDAPLRRYVPEFTMRKRYDHNTVTVRSIMTHHSGIPGDLMKLAEFGVEPNGHINAQLLRQLTRQLPTRRVGEAWAYSNIAITLLQNVVENVSGMSFERYTQRNMFRPMGMRSTTFDDSKPTATQLAANYQVATDDDGNTRVIRRQREYINIRPAGSVVSNARDMARYLRTMIDRGRTPNDDRVLRRQTVAEMITPQKRAPWDVVPFRMGLIWWLGYFEPGLGSVVNHGGDTYFHHSMAAWLPDTRIGVFVSVNTSDQTGVRDTVWERAMYLMREAKTGQPPPTPPNPAPIVPPDQRQMNAMAGHYANSRGVVDVEIQGDALAITSGAQDPGSPTRLVTLRSDGWYASDEGGSAWRADRIDGQQVLLGRTPSGAVGLAAQRIPADYRIPARWRSRMAIYRPVGIDPNSYPLDPSGSSDAALWQYEGIMLLNSTVMRPENSHLAYSYGPTPMQVMRDAGFALEQRDGNLLWQGVRLVKKHDLPQDVAARAVESQQRLSLPWQVDLSPRPGAPR